jgi:L-ascorbate metabolism protein UlaG (beta-lactamase superfamily)
MSLVNHVQVTHFDTAMTLIEIGSLRLLTDPVLDPAGAVFHHGPITLEKTGPAATDAESLGRIDAVLLSHDQHADNLDEAGRSLLAQVPRVLTTVEAADRLGGRAVGLAPWTTAVLVGADGFALTVTASPAQHGPDGTLSMTGPVTGFLLSWEGRPNAVYISGDTVPHAGTREIARRAAPVDLAILHLGRVTLPGAEGMTFSMSATEAAQYACDLGARAIVPVHYEGWRHFSEGREAARAAFAATDLADRVTWLEPGSPRRFTL